MKILIAYDGSESADAAVEDLIRAGLPETAQALVLSVGEIVATSADTTAKNPVVEAQEFAQSATERLMKLFPKWSITAEASQGAAQQIILEKEQSWSPDMIVVGSHGRTGFRRWMLGSVSHEVLKRAKCTVRIGRRADHSQPPRLIIGTDGSAHAKAMIQSVAARHWPAGTQVRIVSVVDSRTWLMTAPVETPGTMYSPLVEQQLRAAADKAAQNAKADLAATGLSLTPEVRVGMPADVLLGDADQWKADCIFLGAKGLNALQRLFLGSVSTAIAMRAPCSVEATKIPVTA